MVASQSGAGGSRERSVLLSLLLVYFTVFVDMLGVQQIIPVLPFLVGVQQHREGFSEEALLGLEPGTAMSAVMAAFMGAQMLSTLVAGPLSDRLGRRPLLLASLLGGVLGYGLQGLAIVLRDFRLFLVARFATGLSGGSRPVAVAYIADAAVPEKRAKLLGLVALSATFAMQLGAGIGGFLGSVHLAVPCFVTGALSLVGAALVWCFVTEVDPVQHAEEADPQAKLAEQTGCGGAAVQNCLDSHLGLLLLDAWLSFCCGFWIIAKSSGVSLLMPARFGFKPRDLGMMGLGDGLMVLLGTPVYLFLIKHIRLPLVAAVGCLLETLVVLLPLFEASAAFTLAASFTSSLGVPIATPAASAIVAVIAPPKRRGAWAGMVLAFQGLGRSIGPIVLGMVYDVDLRLSFWILGAVPLCGVLASALMFPSVPKLQCGMSPHPEELDEERRSD